MSNVDLLARAYALADTGKYSTVTQIRKALAKEGFSLFQLTQLAGKGLQTKLKSRMALARSKLKTGNFRSTNVAGED